MNCIAKLVDIFGSQAAVGRAFQVDRAVVNHWVKVGYIPARWASEVERVTNGQIAAVDVVDDASAKKPVKVKSRPEDTPFGFQTELESMSKFAVSKRIQSFHPPQMPGDDCGG